MSRWGALVVLVGCYSPSVQSGLPCSEDGSCPAGQVCDQSQSPPTCGTTGGDGGVGPDADGSVADCSMGCSDDTPVCDSPSQTCRGCIADSECSSDVCHELTGECVPEGHTVFVAPNGTGSNCTRTAPCGQLDDASNQLTAVRDTIKLADGRYTERLELRLENGATNIIVSGPDRSWDGPEIVAGLSGNRIEQNLTVVIEGVSLVGSGGNGLESQGSVTLSRVLVRGSNDAGVVGRGPTTRILDCRIETSANRGVLITSGVATIERTVISANAGGGLSIENGAAYSVVNTIIGGNGTLDKPNAGVRIAGTGAAGALAVFRFNTVAGNRAGLGSIVGIECNRPVMIESSIVANSVPLIQQELSGMCSAQSSLFENTAPTGNLTGDPMFISTTDFHIRPGSPAVDAAPATGAPSVDVDGDPRTGADAPDLGADELP